MLIKKQNQQKSVEYFQCPRSEMLDFVPCNAKIILDVGCASGQFGQSLKVKQNAEVWGVELDENAASIASQNLDKVICGAFSPDLNLPKSYFDCIIFNDVLEHLIDPSDALTYCQQLLNYEGVVVASIPNVRYFDNIWNLLIEKNWEYTEWGILDKTHLRFFTHRSIISTFEVLGYRVESIEGISPLQESHPHLVKKFKFLNRLFLNNIEDMNYKQFAVVAKLNQ